MGVRTLVGTADATTPAAAMYDSTTGWMIGPIWEGDDAPEQIEAFLRWLETMAYARDEVFPEIGLTSDEMPHLGCDGTDPRHWGARALEKLAAYWRSRHVDDGALIYETG